MGPQHPYTKKKVCWKALRWLVQFARSWPLPLQVDEWRGRFWTVFELTRAVPQSPPPAGLHPGGARKRAKAGAFVEVGFCGGFGNDRNESCWILWVLRFSMAAMADHFLNCGLWIVKVLGTTGCFFRL